MPTLLELDPADPRAAALMNAQQRELRELYQDTDERTEPFDPRTLTGEGSVLLGLEEEGELLACVALKRLGAHDAEVKRMYTVPAARGRGLGGQILSGLVERGRALGYARLLLETGDQQHAAIRLYEGAGFARIPNYGYYVGMENSVCYALELEVSPRPEKCPQF